MRLLAHVIAVGFLTALATPPASAQIRFTRDVSVDITIADRQITLNDSRDLWPESAVLRVWIVDVIDKPLADGELAAGLRQAMNMIASQLTRFYDTYAEFVAAAPGGGVAGLSDLTALIFLNNISVDLRASFTDAEGETERLAADGFESLASRSFDLEGVTYTGSRWAKMDDREVGPFGTAQAVISLHLPAFQFDQVTSEFTGNFAVASSDISVDGVPDMDGGRKRAERLLADYRAELDEEIRQALAALNTPHTVLSTEDRFQFGTGGVGTLLEYEKLLNYPWKGEEKAVALTVHATLGDLVILGVTP